MTHTAATKIVVSSHNGFEDDEKFVEIDGVKYKADESDPSKPALDDKGEKIAIVDKSNDDKGGDKTLEELAKTNPEIAKLLDEKKQLEADKKKAEDDARKKAEEDAEKKGEWQELANKRGTELEALKKQLEQKEEILGKYVGSTKTMLAEVMKTIPDDKKGLIPENFSPREKLEYITKNAKVLGAKVGTSSGGGVPPNDDTPPPTEEAKLVADIAELNKKENKTQADHTKIFELSKKLKEVRAAK